MEHETGGIDRRLCSLRDTVHGDGLYRFLWVSSEGSTDVAFTFLFERSICRDEEAQAILRPLRPVSVRTGHT